MNAVRTVIAAILVLSAVGCHKPSDSTPANSPPTGKNESDVATSSTGESFFLESGELEGQKALAKKGDNRAAIRVADHYGLGEAKPTEAYPWLLLAAERGDIGAMRSLGVYLSSEGGLDNCRKALEWIERAKQEASPQEDQQHGITDTYRHLKEDFDGCVRKR